MSPAAPPPLSTTAPRQFLRFAGLAGAGWLLDAALLLTLVALGLDARRANVASSCTAALTVFLLSRQRIFDRASHHLPARIAIYLVYTLCLILAASFAIGGLVRALGPWLGPHVAPDRAAFFAAAIAKVIVTPPQLGLNFLVSRFLSEKKFSEKNSSKKKWAPNG